MHTTPPPNYRPTSAVTTAASATAVDHRPGPQCARSRRPWVAGWQLLVISFLIDPFAHLPGRSTRGHRATSPDRGDVPGWVLITMMTAGLVVALWALAGDAFTSMFEDSMSKVRGSGR